MKKILLIEDETFIQELYTRFFTKGGYKVASANDGEEAIAFLEDTLPDLILLDIMMPNMNGYEVLDRIKNDEHTKEIPVFVLSNLAGPNEIKQAMERGAVQYIVKSQHLPKDILGMIDQYFEESTQVKNA